ncbi:hypothetical protein AVEN_16804-1 [Araneus ventricosus]|uniref:Reverse transcriptase Ty1/copia-type domain-containing protein n=1 Tax=Araneus ventricosus TaxID=182803 RepID=A0A4Y2BPY7_ARAVE|nr:hypothetical protein AVEN_16804-1 [Araneus ventricosus]
MDIIAAYLNGTFEEDIYMAQSEGCTEGKEHLVCNLKKSLYGLKQSGRVRNSCLDEFLTQYGLRRTNEDPCIYYNCERSIIIEIYVDGLLIIGRIQEIENFKEKSRRNLWLKILVQLTSSYQ